MACDSPFYVTPKAALTAVPVPCGRCPPCKMRRVNSWVFRLLQEEKRSSHAHFVTLTYHTDSVPISNHGYMTVCKSDFQKFMKRLRKLLPGREIKYFAAAEYGTNNERPHYHAIIFNVPDQTLYEKAWTLNDKLIGYVHVGNVTGDIIAYTTKYIDKPSGKKFRHRDDRYGEFSLMSKNLGENYLSDEIIKYHQADISRMYVTRPGGVINAMPRYYRLKIYDEQQRKLQRLLAEQKTEQLELKNQLHYEQTYGDNPNTTYHDYREGQKYARHTKFYKNQKIRTL